MSQPHVLILSGSASRKSSTSDLLRLIARRLEADGAAVDLIDLAEEPLPLFNPDTTYAAPYYAPLKARVERADVYLVGTPDYHGTMSSATKNFLDYFWKEYTGKLFATVVASHDKGLTVADHLRTVARQCYAWALPYTVTFVEKADIKEGRIVNDALRDRIEMLVRDLRVYGTLLAAQRRADLAGTEPGYLAQMRATSG
jgi:NAD(P)H-dependent FMN reductase